MKKYLLITILAALAFTGYGQNPTSTPVKVIYTNPGSSIIHVKTATGYDTIFSKGNLSFLDNRFACLSIGPLYVKKSWANTADFTTAGGSATVALSGSNLLITGSGGGADNVKLRDTSFYNYWSRDMSYIVQTAAGATTRGLGLGQQGTGTFANQTFANLDLSTNATYGGHLVIYAQATTPQVAKSVGTIAPPSIGDSIIIHVERIGNQINAWAKNVTQNSATLTVSYICSTAYSATTINLNNVGVTSIFMLGNNGDHYKVYSLSVASNEIKNAPVIGAGNSKMYGIGARNYFDGITAQLSQYFSGVVNAAMPSGTTSDDISRLPTLLPLIRPGTAFLYENGTNESDTVAFKRNMKRLRDSVVARGGIFIPFDAFPQKKAAGISPLWRKNYVTANYSNVIKVYDNLAQYGMAALSRDSIHLSSLGDSIVARAALSSGLLFGNRGYTERNRQAEFFSNQPTSGFVLNTEGMHFQATNGNDYFTFPQNGQSFVIQDPHDNGSGHLARIVFNNQFGGAGAGAIFTYNYDGDNDGRFNHYFIMNQQNGLQVHQIMDNQGCQAYLTWSIPDTSFIMNTRPGSTGRSASWAHGFYSHDLYTPNHSTARGDFNSNTQGFIIPRLTSAQRLAIHKEVIGTITASGGSSYVNGQVVNFTGGGPIGNGAVGIVLASGGAITGINITDPGYSYDFAPTPVFTNGSGGTITITMTWLRGLKVFDTDLGCEMMFNGTLWVQSGAIYMTTTNRTGYASPWAGMRVFDTTLNKEYEYDGGAWNGLW